jgi:GNAT superfamily N-acetyltransferase
MQVAGRNVFVDGNWILKKVEDSVICDLFDCSDDDLNEYFHKDAALYKAELLTQTYYIYVKKYPFLPLVLLDFCNDLIHVEKYKTALKINPDAAQIDPSKYHLGLPAVKLTRFGVHRDFQRISIGSHALNIVKKFFITDNRTGCRFLTVDAYNKPGIIDFYKKNGFELFSDKDKQKRSRALYFDLKRLTV